MLTTVIKFFFFDLLLITLWLSFSFIAVMEAFKRYGMYETLKDKEKIIRKLHKERYWAITACQYAWATAFFYYTIPVAFFYRFVKKRDADPFNPKGE